MIQIIVGEKGKGKTKYLIEKANDTKHMYELNNKIRLVNVNDYLISSTDGFKGFICGMLSANHDISCVFLDSFLKLANLDNSHLSDTLEFLDSLGDKCDVDFILSISTDLSSLPEPVKPKVIVSL